MNELEQMPKDNRRSTGEYAELRKILGGLKVGDWVSYGRTISAYRIARELGIKIVCRKCSDLPTETPNRIWRRE